MIGRADIEERVREWGLRFDVVEKDYVLGWLLWGIATNPTLGQTWIFKGGTCLKKCYIETYRFSEDLDFTVIGDGPLHGEEMGSIFDGILRRVAEESGIAFDVRPPRFRTRPDGVSSEGRVYYRGPLGSPQPGSIKLDLTADEAVVRPPVLREITHPHADALPQPARARCYGFEEVFAEKLRALTQRCRPRDLYDVVHLYRRHDLRTAPELIRSVFKEKCAAKGMAVPGFGDVANSPFKAELVSEWANMLGHQLPALPPLESFWDELPTIFAWLEGAVPAAVLPAVPMAEGEEASWRPPPTVATWRQGVPLESVRFAAANLLCVELTYGGDRRLIEPYSLRRTRDGRLLLHAVKADSREHRSYRVDRIQAVTVTKRPFRPVYAVEFSQAGPIVAQPSSANAMRRPTAPRRARRASRPGTVYIIQCTVCAKQFRRSRRGSTLRPHKSPDGWPCPGRRGYLAEIRRP